MEVVPINVSGMRSESFEWTLSVLVESFSKELRVIFSLDPFTQECLSLQEE